MIDLFLQYPLPFVAFGVTIVVVLGVISGWWRRK